MSGFVIPFFDPAVASKEITLRTGRYTGTGFHSFQGSPESLITKAYSIAYNVRTGYIEPFTSLKNVHKPKDGDLVVPPHAIELRKMVLFRVKGRDIAPAIFMNSATFRRLGVDERDRCCAAYAAMYPAHASILTAVRRFAASRPVPHGTQPGFDTPEA